MKTYELRIRTSEDGKMRTMFAKRGMTEKELNALIHRMTHPLLVGRWADAKAELRLVKK